MVDVRTETIINAPSALVAGFAADPMNATKWYVNIKRAEWLTPPALELGARIRFTAHFLGKAMTYTYEVTDYSLGERLVMRTAEGPFPMETTYEWTPITENQTRMRLRNRGNPNGFSNLVAPVMEWAMRRANRKDLAKLKELLETPS